MGNKENDLLYRGEKGALCERFDLIDSVGLHAQIRRCWSGLLGRGPVLNSREERIKLEPRNPLCVGDGMVTPSPLPRLVLRGKALGKAENDKIHLKKDLRGPIAFQGSWQKCARDPETSPKGCWAESAAPGTVPMRCQEKGDLLGIGDLAFPLGFSPGASTG